MNLHNISQSRKTFDFSKFWTISLSWSAGMQVYCISNKLEVKFLKSKPDSKSFRLYLVCGNINEKKIRILLFG